MINNREDKYYVHKGVVGMYKSIISLYSKKCVIGDFVFIPDIFNTRFDWSSINFTDHMLQIIPEISDTSRKDFTICY